MIAREAAGNVREQYGTSEPEEVAAREGVEVVAQKGWSSRYHETVLEGLILIPQVLSVPRRRTHIAHALGHHFMHEGNQSWIRKHDQIWDAKLERQAKEFAAWLTIEYIDEERMMMSDAGVANHYQVTEELAQIRRVG